MLGVYKSPVRILLEEYLHKESTDPLIIPYSDENIGEASKFRSILFQAKRRGEQINVLRDKINKCFIVTKEG